MSNSNTYTRERGRQTGGERTYEGETEKSIPKLADEWCVYRGCQGESVNHPTANLHMNKGNRFGGDPAVGSSVSYGLGTENANLPSFVVLPGEYYPQTGAPNWSNGYLPAHHQGTPLRSAAD